MRTARSVIVVALASWLAGCAIHPLPEDVTGNTTYAIVQKIRCEARDALDQLAIRGLRESTNPRTISLADLLAERRVTILDLFMNPHYMRDVDREVHNNFDVFTLSALAFDFSLVGTENNDAAANANFGWPFGGGLFTLNVSGGTNLERQNDRKLQVGHTFLELYDRTSKEVCEQIVAGTGNLIYPITGKIGLDEVINTFYLLNRPYNPSLQLPVDRYGIAITEAYRNKFDGGNIKKVSDTLQFTTSFVGGSSPFISLDPVPGRVFRFVNATATLAARRKDIHRVAISVEMGPVVTSLAHARGLAGLRATEPSRQVAKRRAFERLDELRTDSFFDSQREIRQQLGLPPL
jgi:hypothetical protein